MLARAFDRLPPLVSVVAMFVGLTLPQALLGLPVAAAAIGPLPALGVLLAVGAVMTVAAAAEAEALVRDAEFRRQGGFFGRLVQRYLGTAATILPDGLAGLRTSISVLGAYVGFAVTLSALTGLPRPLWGGVALLALAALLLRGGLRITPALGAALGLICLPPLVAICVLAVVHGGGGLTPLSDFSAASLGGVVGLAVMLYISNVYVVRIAAVSLPRDPGGRSLVLGSALGTVAMTALAAVWLLACSAALVPAELEGEVGTVLGPLADSAGPAVAVLGAVLTVLLLGLGMERTSIAVMKLLAERLPPTRQRLAILAPLAICLLGEALLGAGAVSFSAIFGVAGIATNVLLAIALPLLLLLAARAGGDLRPGRGAVLPLFGAPAAAWAVVLLAALLLAGFATVLADTVLLRVAALVSLAALATTVALARRAGAFAQPA